MGSMAISPSYYKSNSMRTSINYCSYLPSVASQQKKQNCSDSNGNQLGRREIILRSSEIALLGAIFQFRFLIPSFYNTILTFLSFCYPVHFVNIFLRFHSAG